MTIHHIPDPDITVHAMPDYKPNPFIGVSFGPPGFVFNLHLSPVQAAELARVLTAAVAEFPAQVPA